MLRNREIKDGGLGFKGLLWFMLILDGFNGVLY